MTPAQDLLNRILQRRQQASFVPSASSVPSASFAPSALFASPRPFSQPARIMPFTFPNVRMPLTTPSPGFNFSNFTQQPLSAAASLSRFIPGLPPGVSTGLSAASSLFSPDLSIGQRVAGLGQEAFKLGVSQFVPQTETITKALPSGNLISQAVPSQLPRTLGTLASFAGLPIAGALNPKGNQLPGAAAILASMILPPPFNFLGAAGIGLGGLFGLFGGRQGPSKSQIEKQFLSDSSDIYRHGVQAFLQSDAPPQDAVQLGINALEAPTAEASINRHLQSPALRDELRDVMVDRQQAFRKVILASAQSGQLQSPTVQDFIARHGDLAGPTLIRRPTQPEALRQQIISQAAPDITKRAIQERLPPHQVADLLEEAGLARGASAAAEQLLQSEFERLRAALPQRQETRSIIPPEAPLSLTPLPSGYIDPFTRQILIGKQQQELRKLLGLGIA